MKKISITTSSFSQSDNDAIDLLKSNGIVYNTNPYGRKLTSTEAIELCKDSEAIIAGLEDLDLLVETSNELKFICRLGVGLDNVPFKKCEEKNIKVSYTPDSVTPAISELTLTLMLSLLRNIVISDKEIKNKNWTRMSGRRIGACKVGVLGFGRVGSKLCELLVPFNPTSVLIHDINYDDEKIFKLKKMGLSIEKASFEELLINSDLISIHLSLNSKTANLFTENEFDIMKPTSMLVNTSRGGIISESCLHAALSNKNIAGAALDVFENEPYDGELINLDNVILSPHQGSATIDCRKKMEMEAVNECINYFNNIPMKNQINKKY